MRNFRLLFLTETDLKGFSRHCSKLANCGNEINKLSLSNTVRYMTSRNLNDSEVLNIFKLPELLRSSKRIINIFQLSQLIINMPESF